MDWAQIATASTKGYSLSILAMAIQNVLKAGGASRQRQAHANELIDGLDVLQTIRRPLLWLATERNCVGALSTIANSYWNTGDRERAAQILAHAEVAMNKLPDKGSRVHTLPKLAIAQATCGHGIKAAETMRQFIAESPTEVSYETFLIKVATRFADVKDSANFKNLLPYFVSSFELAVKAWELLVKLYPDQGDRLALAILEQVRPYVRN